jgi:hypothetical protein
LDTIKTTNCHIKALITIDTEADADPHWNKPTPLEFTSVIYGIPSLLRPIWDKYNVKPLYFVSPEVLSNSECCRILRDEIAKGCIIGAHLHSEYIEPQKKNIAGKPSNDFPCYANSTAVEYEKIHNLVGLLETTLDITPEWYRAGRFGADLDTIKSLKKLRFKYDSSVTPHINWETLGGPNHSNAPEHPYWIAKDQYYRSATKEESLGILEVPVTIGKKRFGVFGNLLSNHWLWYNWLRPTHMTIYEQKQLISRFLQKYHTNVYVMMFHSMEILINKTPYVKNTLMQSLFLKRIEKIIAFLQHLDRHAFHGDVEEFVSSSSL